MRQLIPYHLILLFLSTLVWSCTPQGDSPGAKEKPQPLEYVPQPVEPRIETGLPAADAAANAESSGTRWVIHNATVMTAAGMTYENGYVVVESGRIQEVGEGQPENMKGRVIDAGKQYLTPGLIDTHSHIGVYPMPGVGAHSDGNEATSPSRADVWAEHSFWPQDPGLWRALGGGVTTIQVLPGSANLIGGRTTTLRTVPETTVAEMMFPGAPQGLKMACGENPKRVYGDKGGPSTRMGNVAGFRDYFQRAWEYRQSWQRYERDLAHWQKRRGALSGDDGDALRELGDPPKAPKRDHALDTLVGAMNDEILVHVHCYRADDMAWMMKLAEQYGFNIRSFHHALEAYKIRDQLAERQVSVSTWADWWGFKMEAFDGVPQNAALVHAAGARSIIHSDSAEDIRFLNVEAAKAQTAGELVGVEVSDNEALQWITLNPAWALGIDDQVGSIEVGKLADLVLWDRHPLSVYAKPEKVLIEGEVVFDRAGEDFPLSDFEQGIRTYGLADGSQLTKPEDFRAAPAASRSTVAMNGLSPDLSGQFAIRNARVEIGDGRVLPEATVWVDKNRIKAVGPTAEVKLPDEVPVVQADGGVVTPGLIEIQSSLGLVVVGMESQAQDHRSGQGMHPGFQAIDGFDPFSLRIPIAREHGVTTAMIRPTGGIVSGMGTLIDLRPAAEVMEQAHGSYLFARVATRRNNRGEFWMKLREAFDDARLYQDYLRGEKKQPVAHQLSLKPVHLEALGHVLKGQAPIMLEAHRVSDIYAALRFLDEMKAQGHPLKMVILGGEEAWLAKEALAKAQVPVVVTPTKQMPYTLDRLRVRDDNPTLLARAGVDVVISSSDRNVRRLRQQAGRAVAFGMDYGDAIQAVTSTPARVLGLDDRGLIEPGKRADLVLWDGDPLQPQSTARKVWIKGEDQPLKNRQRTLSRRYATQKVAH